MEKKYTPFILLSYTAMIFESNGKTTFEVNNEKIKNYEIQIKIMNSEEWFIINMDDQFNTLLFRGSNGSIIRRWRLQDPTELEKNKNNLGEVIVKKENKFRKKYHEFDVFWDEIKRD